MFPPGQSSYEYDVLQLNLRETAFIVVDVYGLAYGSDDSIDTDEPEWSKAQDLMYRDVVREFVAPATESARMAPVPVIYLTNHLSNTTTERNEFRRMNMRTYGFDILTDWEPTTSALAYADIVAPRSGDYEVKKQHYSGFFETSLDSLLRELGARTVVLVGVDARVCVGATAMDALFRGYRVIVLRDCVKSYEFPETAQGEWATFIAIREIESVVGYTSTRDEWSAACAGVSGGGA
jgi:ureidoacrylate peracid hydrolase